MKCCASPWPELLLYVSGMLFVIFGFGALIVSINPKPLEREYWKLFLSLGICFLMIGGILLFLTATIPELPGRKIFFRNPSSRTFVSAVDLLDDVQSVSCGDSPIVKLREAGIRESEESVKVVKHCMMMQSPVSSSVEFLYYKETVV